MSGHVKEDLNEKSMDYISDMQAIETMPIDELDDLLAGGLSFEDLEAPSRREVRKQVKKFRTKF